MSIKKDSKRLMLTLSIDDIDKLKIIMFDLKTRQPSKAIKYLLNNYKKEDI